MASIMYCSISKCSKNKYLTLILMIMLLLVNPFLTFSFFSYNNPIPTVSAVSHVPPEDAPTLNETFNWGNFFNTSPSLEPSLNLSYPPTTDFLPLFGSGLIDPFQLLFTVYPADDPHYWRLETYDYFDGHSWNKTQLTKVQKNGLDSSTGQTEYTITLNLTHGSVDSRYLPTLWPNEKLLSYIAPSDAFSTTFYEDAYGLLIMDTLFASSGTSIFQYVTTYDYVDLDTIQENALPPEYTPSDIRSLYLQVPSNLDSSVYSFAGQFSFLSGDTYYRALYIMAYFRTHFTFDYDMFINGSSGPPADTDVVSWFLSRGGGTAAHFATAYAIVLRLNGIAARPVFGFTPGFREGSIRKVYAINFHVWVDVWIPTTSGGMWVQFDPTPLPDELLPEKDDSVMNIVYKLNIVDPGPFLVNRFNTFSVTAQLLQNEIPAPNFKVSLYDLTEDLTLDSTLTNASGYVTFNITFNNSFVAGQHTLVLFTDFVANETIVFLSGDTNVTLVLSSEHPLWQTNFVVSGKLYDPLNGKGIRSQNVTFIFDGVKIGSTFTDSRGNYRFALFLDPNTISLGPHTVKVIFSGNMTLSSTVNTTSVTVETIPTLTISLSPTRVEHGKFVNITGALSLVNGTLLGSENIELHWVNSSGDFIINITSTDLNGSYLISFHISSNHEPSIVTVYAFYSSPYPFIRNATSPNRKLIVYMNITIVFMESPDFLNHSQSFIINGTVYDDKGNPLPDVSLLLLFNDTALPVDDGSAAVVDSSENGSFYLELTTPPFLIGMYRLTFTTNQPIYEPFSDEAYIEVWSYTQTNIIDITPEFVLAGENTSITIEVLDDNSNAVPGNLTLYVNGVEVAHISNPTGVAQVVIPIPESYNEPTVNVSFSFIGKRFYWGSSSTIATIYVFHNVTIILQVTPTENVSAGDTVQISGIVHDEYDRNITERQVRIYMNTTKPLVQIFVGEVTVINGSFSINYTIPATVENQTVIFYAIFLSEKEIIRSSEISIRILATETPSQGGNMSSGGAPFMQVGLNMLYYALGILIIILFVAVLYKYRDLLIYEGLLSLFSRKKSTLPPEIKSMLKDLSAVVETEKYKEGILLAQQILNIILTQYKGERRAKHETLREYLYRIASKYGIPVGDIEDFLVPYEKAKYSTKTITKEDYIQTIQSFARLYSLLTGEEFVFA